MNKIKIIFKSLFTLVLFVGSISLATCCPSEDSHLIQAWNLILTEGTLLIDVRTVPEFNSGHLENAINIPLDVFVQEMTTNYPDKSQSIVVYCRSGNRSGIAQRQLINLGYQNVINGGGYVELSTVRKCVEEYKQ